jgi:hypothetical protein
LPRENPPVAFASASIEDARSRSAFLTEKVDNMLLAPFLSVRVLRLGSRVLEHFFRAIFGILDGIDLTFQDRQFRSPLDLGLHGHWLALVGVRYCSYAVDHGVPLFRQKKKPILLKEWAKPVLYVDKLGSPATHHSRAGGFASHSFERFAFHTLLISLSAGILDFLSDLLKTCMWSLFGLFVL